MRSEVSFLVIGLVIFGAIAFAIAGGSSDELAELENNLTASGLIDYNLNSNIYNNHELLYVNWRFPW